MSDDITWEFEDLNASGQKQGGDPSELAFDADFDTFVREAVQNSNDAAVDRPAEILFDLKQVEGEKLEQYKSSLIWDKLSRHLRAAAEEGRMKKADRFLNRINNEESLRILKIEDRHCEGLTGEEEDDSSNFTGLLKHTLISNKGEKDSSGGTYGLGKSVYWRFSEASTVLFNSVLTEEPEGKESPRFMGRINLPSHTLESEDGEVMQYQGPGWLGKKGKVEINGQKQQRAFSVWSEEAQTLSEKLHVEHERGSTGTSISILGFTDPTEERKDIAEIENLMEDSVIRHFWPALYKKRNYLNVKIRDKGGSERDVRIVEEDPVWPFVACWDAYLNDNFDDQFKNPGDIASREIELELPDERDGSETATGKATLVVRRADEDVDTEMQDQVAMFRNPGMVVKYWNQGGLSVAAEPFHAILIAGEARSEADPSEGESELEDFLKKAEPPEHNRWTSTEKLKHDYKPGSAKAVKRTFPQKIRSELKDVVVPEVKGGDRGPEKLSSKFSLSRKSGGDRITSRGSALNFEGLTGYMQDGVWHFQGLIETEIEDHDGWTATLELTVVGEDGSRYDPIEIDAVKAPPAKTKEKGAKMVIEASPDTDMVSFDGVSRAVDEDISNDEIELRITGSVERKSS